MKMGFPSDLADSNLKSDRPKTHYAAMGVPQGNNPEDNPMGDDSDDQMNDDSDDQMEDVFEGIDETDEQNEAVSDIREAEDSQKVLREHPKEADEAFKENDFDPSPSAKGFVHDKLEEYISQKFEYLKESYKQEGETPENAEKKAEHRMGADRNEFDLGEAKSNLSYFIDNLVNNNFNNDNNNSNNDNNNSNNNNNNSK
jgi:hypothetical protein